MWAIAVTFSVVSSQPARAPAVSNYNRDGETGASAPDQRTSQIRPIVVRLEQTQEQKAAADKADRQADDNASFARAQTYFNGILALCAVATIIVIIRQVLINKGQLSTQRAELRAYVSADIKSISRFNTNISPRFIFECINHGKTPAKDVEFRATMGVFPTESSLLHGLNHVPWNARRMNLFPNASEASADRGQITCDCGRVFTSQEIDQVRAGTHFLFIGIEIQYWDFMVNAGHVTRNYFRLGGHPVALRILTSDGEEIEISGLPKELLVPTFSLLPGCSQIT